MDQNIDSKQEEKTSMSVKEIRIKRYILYKVHEWLKKTKKKQKLVYRGSIEMSSIVNQMREQIEMA